MLLALLPTLLVLLVALLVLLVLLVLALVVLLVLLLVMMMMMIQLRFLLAAAALPFYRPLLLLLSIRIFSGPSRALKFRLETRRPLAQGESL